MTEQQFTENTRIDDELVENNTVYSVFLDDYYQSLQVIVLGNRQLLNAQEQFRWYTSKLDEVDKLADEVSIPNSSTFLAVDLQQLKLLSRSDYNQLCKSFFQKIAELKDTRVKGEKEITDASDQGIKKLSTERSKARRNQDDVNNFSEAQIKKISIELSSIETRINELNIKIVESEWGIVKTNKKIAQNDQEIVKRYKNRNNVTNVVILSCFLVSLVVVFFPHLSYTIFLVIFFAFSGIAVYDALNSFKIISGELFACNPNHYKCKIRQLDDEKHNLTNERIRLKNELGIADTKKADMLHSITAEQERAKKKIEGIKKNSFSRISNVRSENSDSIGNIKIRNSNKLSVIKCELNDLISSITVHQRKTRHQATRQAPMKFNELVGQSYRTLATISSKIDSLDCSPPRLITLPWHDRRWTLAETDQNSYAPQTDGLAPEMLRIGNLLRMETLSLDQLKHGTNIPAFLPIRCLSPHLSSKMPGHIVIFSNDAKSRQAAVSAIESIALRLISTFPVRKLQGIFIDPVNMGNSFPFKSLPKYIVGQQTYTRTDDVREQLRKLTVHTEQIIQNCLSRYYQSIEEYNAVKSAVEEAYRYLFVADFPTNFDSTSWEDLKSLLLNGSRAGVYGIIHIDETLEKPRNFNYNIFNDSCTVIRPLNKYHQGQTVFEMTMPNGLTCEISLDEPPPNEQFNLITAAITATAKTIRTDTVSFGDIYPSEFWVGDSRREIRAPIGVTGARDKIEFWMGNNEDGLVVSSALLAGKPGAGKSYTLHAIITSLAMKYSPDELELYLLDFKEGVEFQLYIDPEQSDRSSQEPNENRALPHAKVISIESDREFGLSVLQQVQKQIEERANKFKTPGVNVENLKQYRDKTGEKMPRILVVIDEFQYMFKERDSITDGLNLIFEDIMRRGRAFGIHLLLASQSPNVPNMSNTLYSYIDLRMAMQMDQSTASSVLAEGNTDAVDLLDRPGKLIYNSDLGRKGSNNVGQVADVSQQERIKAVLQTQAVAKQLEFERSTPLIVFNGTRPSKLAYNGQLAKLAAMDNWLSSTTLNKQIVQNQDWFPQEFPGVVWLGESMKIGNHTQAIFRRRQRSNLLLIGGAEESIFGTLGGVLLSLVHCYQPAQVQFQIVDLSQSLDEENDGWTTMSVNFRDCFSNYFPIEVGKRFPDADRQIPKAEHTLRKAFDELELRLAKQKENPDELNLGQPYFLVCAIGSLNRTQYLRPVAGKRGEEMSEDAQKLMNLVAQGPELGIHTILWVDNMATFRQLSGDSRSALSPFDLRVGLAMPENDSRDLLGEGYAKNLPRLRAYYRDMLITDGLEKFKPYAVPSLDDMQKYELHFQQRLLGRNNRG